MQPQNECETLSLHQLCKNLGLPKTSVRRWLIAQGFDTANGVNDEALDAVIAQFCPAPVDAPIATTTFETGNHRGSLSLPTQPASIDLGAYRGEDAALTTFEPEDIDRFLSACDGFMSAVDADYEHQKTLTQQKEAAAAKVKAKVEQVKQAQLLYQVRSESLALHNRGLDADLKDGLSTLGKPPGAG